MKDVLHIIPAAGKASRIGGIPKFLLPIDEDNFLIKFHSTLLNNSKINIQKVIVVSSEFFKTVQRLNLDAEIIKADTASMNETIKFAINSFPEISKYILTMPDTFYKDSSIILNLTDQIGNLNTQVALALWKIENYQRGKLGQVLIRNNKIMDVIDKDPNCEYEYAWGAIAWDESVNHLIRPEDPHIGYILKPALDKGNNINYSISSGKYYDCGTFSEYSNLLNS